jgi:hypothetical protein
MTRILNDQDHSTWFGVPLKLGETGQPAPPSRHALRRNQAHPAPLDIKDVDPHRYV